MGRAPGPVGRVACTEEKAGGAKKISEKGLTKLTESDIVNKLPRRAAQDLEN